MKNSKESDEKGNNGKERKGYYFVFYWDPSDKRVFVPKRWGYGWTVNFANPFSILGLFLIIAIVIVLVKVL